MLIRWTRRPLIRERVCRRRHRTSFSWYRSRMLTRYVAEPGSGSARNNFLRFSSQTHAQSSVIQPNQQSVIQTATGNIQPVKSVLLVNSKPNSVIHTTHQAIQVQSGARFNILVWDGQQQTQKIFSSPQIKPEPNIGHMIDSDGDSDLSDDDSPKKRRDLLTRRPSYRKILNDLGGGEIGECCEILPSTGRPLTLTKENRFVGGVLSQSGNPGEQSLHGGGTIVQYSGQDGSLVSYVPGNSTLARAPGANSLMCHFSQQLCGRFRDSRGSIEKARDEVT